MTQSKETKFKQTLTPYIRKDLNCVINLSLKRKTETS